MGTDAYVTFEIRRGGIWEAVDLLPELDTELSLSDPAWENYWQHPAFIDRNYPLFSVLANVRNTFGLPPITDRRGLPADASAFSRQQYAYALTAPDRQQERHGLTHVSLRELLEYDWNRTFEDSRHPHLAPCKLQEEAGAFLTITLPYLQSLVKNPDDLRLICEFD